MSPALIASSHIRWTCSGVWGLMVGLSRGAAESVVAIVAAVDVVAMLR